MVVRLTQRVSWRWMPEPPEEPTDTLVQNVSDWYIDLRMLKTDGSLDYAFAGEETILERGPGDYLTIQWTKMISSRGSLATYVFDVIKPPTGDFLEMGQVPHFATGVPTLFRERWRPVVDVPSTARFPWAWILESEDGKCFLGLVGGVFQALRGHEGPGGMDGFCARREIWDGTKETWTTKYEGGDASRLPSLPRMADETGAGSGLRWQSTARAGDVIDAFGGRYIVRAIEQIE